MNTVLLRPVLADEHRVALVIGNNHYTHIRSLENAVSDAGAVAHLLGQFHFDVVSQANLGRPAMLSALSEFDRRLSPGDVAAFYYAGHGVEYSDGVDYLLGTDAELDPDGHVLDGLVLSKILNNIMQRTPRFALAIIDACRTNPLVPRTRGLDGLPDGLSAIVPASGMMVVYSTGANQVADDVGPDESHGLFVSEFLKYASRSNEDIDQVMKQVQNAVYMQALTNRVIQMPAVYNEFVGKWYLASRGPQAQEPAVNTSPVPEIVTSYDKGVVAYRDENFDEALRQFQAAAEQGDGRAMTSIGYLYDKGLGTPRNRDEALRWYQKGAAVGDAAAFHNLGVFYQHGIGVPKDYPEALRWYLKAVDAGVLRSIVDVGRLYQRAGVYPRTTLKRFSGLSDQRAQAI